MANALEGITLMHSASRFYVVQELDERLGAAFWPMLDLGGPLDATDSIAAGGMTSRRQFPEQIIWQGEAP